MDKPKEADKWYKQALERARNIAKNLGQSTNNASQSKPEISCHKSTGDVPSQIAYGNNEQLKLERGKIILNLKEALAYWAVEPKVIYINDLFLQGLRRILVYRLHQFCQISRHLLRL